MKDLFDSIRGIVSSAIDHNWQDMGAAIVGTVEHGIGLLTKILGIG